MRGTVRPYEFGDDDISIIANSRKNEAMMLPPPKNPYALKELFVADGPSEDERLWVKSAEDIAFRPLFLSASQGYWMTIARIRRSGVVSRHSHPQPVHGYTITGRWRYLEHDWVAEAGSYIFEPPGDTHTLVVDGEGEGR